MPLVRLFQLIAGSTDVIHECRRCGSKSDADVEECPTCGSSEIARYEFESSR